jgi:integrase/recombinase XerD
MTELYNFESSLKRLLGRIETLEADKEPLKKWYLHFKTDKSESLSVMRIVKMLSNALTCSEIAKTRFNRRLIDATKDDITALIIEINDSKKAALTKRDYRIAVKKFLTFTGKKDSVDWIKTSVSNKEKTRKLPEDLLTESEIELMIGNAINPRDKALISLLADSGLRIGEALNLRIKDINFDDYGAYLIVPDGKTGARRVRLISSIHYLKNWIENHPNPKRDNWLFVTLDKNKSRLLYNAARKGILEATRSARIKKRIHPHLFRHSAATRSASFMTEQEMKVHYGWTGNSEMASIYVHMSGEQVDNKMLSHYGLKKIDDDGKGTLIKCPKCEKLNPKTAKFCGNCSCILSTMLMTESDDVHKSIQKVKEYLFQSQEFMQLLHKAIGEG